MEILDRKKSGLLRLYNARIWLVLLGAFVALSVYVGFLCFGNTSFLTLSRAQKIEQNLRSEIEKVNSQNAFLQKKLFEIKGLEP